TGSNTLLSVNQFGSAAADNSSTAPVFSSDGRMLFFQSWGSDLVGQDFNIRGDLFAFALFYVRVSADGPGPGQWLSWPTIPGAHYRAEFKTNLNDISWQELSGSSTNIGGTAYLSAPSQANQRFFRIVTY